MFHMARKEPLESLTVNLDVLDHAERNAVIECLKELGEVKPDSTVPSVELTCDHKFLSMLSADREPDREVFGNYVADVIRSKCCGQNGGIQQIPKYRSDWNLIQFSNQ